MYQIYDLWNNCTVNAHGKPSDCWFESKEHLLFALNALCHGYSKWIDKELLRPFYGGRTCDMLNMNGKDTYTVIWGYPASEYGETVLRRYMVFDKDNRIVDPRTWDAKPEPPVIPDKRIWRGRFGWIRIPKDDPMLPVFRKDPIPGVGCRHWCYRGADIQGFKQSLVRQEERRSWNRSCHVDDDPLMGFTPVKDSSKPRDHERDAWGDSSHRPDVPGWKNTSKARRQWGKHKKGATRIQNKRVETEIDFDALLEDLREQRATDLTWVI